MAKKKAADGLNMSEEIRAALNVKGLDSPASVIGDYLSEKHANNKQIAEVTGRKNWGVLVSGQRTKLKNNAGGGKPAAKTTASGHESNGKAADFDTNATVGGALSDVAIFCLRHGGIDGARQAIEQLAQQIGK